MKNLIGKKINKILVSSDQSILAFETDSEIVAFEVSGDCCSESWFADIIGVAALLEGTVQTADSVSMQNYNVDDGRTRQDVDEAYGYKITTDKGYSDIVFRNSSNGYYGGYMYPCDLTSTEGMSEITDDWQA